MIFREVVMEAPSPPELLSFYVETLALNGLVDGRDEIAVQAGQTTVRFRRAPEGTKPTYHFAFRVVANDFDSAKAGLAERVDLLRHDGADEFVWDFWGARAIYVHDPAGNIVELMAFPELDPSGAGRFCSESYVGLAELGLPVADPRATVDRLGETFQIGVWDRSEVSLDGLTPVGEQGASFVITPIGRAWLFGFAAEDSPLKIVLGGVCRAALGFSRHPYRIVGAA